MSDLTRRDFLYRSLGTAGTLALAPQLLAADPSGARRRPHVLFLAVDDLRPQLGCYGHDFMQTPHLDALAASGCRFSRAYCNVPVCGASRASLLTGLRPRRDRFFRWDCRADADAPEAVSLPGHLRRHGYRTVSLGKVFHHRADHAADWDRLTRHGLADGEERPWQGRGYRSPEAIAQIRRVRGKRGIGPAYEAADVPDDGYADGRLADAAIAELAAAGERPLFLALGLYKPHLPFCAPRRYWELYDRATIDLADNPFRPKGAPDSALHNWGELRKYVGIPKGRKPMPDDLARSLIHGYYACTSYADALLGRVLAALEEHGLSENTVVVLWGDHGWNLGEHTLWCKHALFETSLHSPLLLRLPGAPTDRVRDELVEYIDIYPTLCAATGLPAPDHLEGASLAPLARDPEATWGREAIFARYYHGESAKTDRYRYSRYYDRRWRPTDEMLYDHAADPAENSSVHADPSHAGGLARMREHLARLAR